MSVFHNSISWMSHCFIIFINNFKPHIQACFLKIPYQYIAGLFPTLLIWGMQDPRKWWEIGGGKNKVTSHFNLWNNFPTLRTSRWEDLYFLPVISFFLAKQYIVVNDILFGIGLSQDLNPDPRQFTSYVTLDKLFNNFLTLVSSSVNWVIIVLTSGSTRIGYLKIYSEFCTV